MIKASFFCMLISFIFGFFICEPEPIAPNVVPPKSEMYLYTDYQMEQQVPVYVYKDDSTVIYFTDWSVN